MKFSWIRKTCALLLAILLTACLCACSGDGDSDTSSAQTSSGTSGDGKTLEARLITPVYESLDTIVAVADVVADYGADPTGKADSTRAIRQALIKVAFAGGGTVWMPKGTYRITNGFSISQGITLRGEFNDSTAKNFNGDYGTVILADVPSSDATNTGLIQLAAGASAEGLTIAYPNQDINDVKPYPYTFFLGSGHRLRTIKNCTLINSYRGVYIGACEMPMIDGLYATCLAEGLCTMSLSDVGCFNNVYFTPDAWANCKLSGIKAATADQISAYSKANKSNGMRIYDVEQQQFRNINISGHYRGLFFPSKKVDTRFMGSGPIFGLFIKDCTYGIYAEEGTYLSNCKYSVEAHPVLTGVDWRSGYNISYGSIEGSKYSIYNGSEMVLTPDGRERVGCFSLTDVTLKGATKGNVQVTDRSEGSNLSQYKVDTARVTKPTGTAFEALTETATLADIQAALDRVGKAGGGVVYLHAGDYYFKEGTLTVPANTELHGSSGCPQRLAYGTGTHFWIQTAPTTKGNADTDPAFITLNGNNAGIRGIYFLYEQNIINIDKDGSYDYFPYAVRGKGKQVYALDLCIAGANYGIDFSNCDGHVVEHLASACIQNTITAGGNNGLLYNCLNNGNVMFRTKVIHTDEGKNMFPNFFNKTGTKATIYIKVSGNNEQVVNCFIYGAKEFIRVENAENLIGINMCSDNLGSYLYNFINSSGVVLNSISTAGKGYYNENSNVKVYNEFALYYDKGKDYGDNKKAQ